MWPCEDQEDPCSIKQFTAYYDELHGDEDETELLKA